MLNDKVKYNMEKFSSLMRKTFKLNIPIMDVSPLVKELGGKIEYGDGIEKKEESFIINIKDDPYSPNGKFNILKLLGVLIFENGLLVDYNKWKSITDIHYPERYELANEFAVSMLMPAFLFTDYFTKEYNVEDTANHFGVSYDLVRSRAKWLGLILF